jgi:hypothetical protein
MVIARSSLPLAVLVLALSTEAYAQGNDLSAPAGGRSALMGNTGVALGRDGAAPFNNPATIVNIRDESLAFSVNYYSLGFSSFDRWHQPGAVDGAEFGVSQLERNRLIGANFRVLPSTVCLFFTLADIVRSGAPSSHGPDAPMPGKKLAICFAALESVDADHQALQFQGQTSAGPTMQVQGVQRRWTRSYIGPAYSLRVTDDVALGFSLQGSYSYDSFAINGSSTSATSAGGGIASALAMSGSGYSFDAVLLVGATYRTGALTLGASLRAPALHLFGSYTGTSEQSVSGDVTSESVISSGSGWLRAAPPVRAAIGGGLSLGRLTLEFDAALVLPNDSLLETELSVHESRVAMGVLTQVSKRQRFGVRQHPTVQPRLGGEYFTSDKFSVLAGVSANLSTLAELHATESVGNLVQARTHQIGAALGLGSHWQGGELLCGFQFDYGWGEALAVNPFVLPNVWSPVATRAMSVTLILSGSTDLNGIMHMVKQVGGSNPSLGEKR